MEYPFRVEAIHDESEAVVLAESAHASVAFACYYAAMKAYPDGQIILYGRDGMLAKSALGQNAS
jgi:hypothetical protein